MSTFCGVDHHLCKMVEDFAEDCPLVPYVNEEFNLSQDVPKKQWSDPYLGLSYGDVATVLYGPHFFVRTLALGDDWRDNQQDYSMIVKICLLDKIRAGAVFWLEGALGFEEDMSHTTQEIVVYEEKKKKKMPKKDMGGKTKNKADKNNKGTGTAQPTKDKRTESYNKAMGIYAFVGGKKAGGGSSVEKM